MKTNLEILIEQRQHEVDYLKASIWINVLKSGISKEPRRFENP